MGWHPLEGQILLTWASGVAGTSNKLKANPLVNDRSIVTLLKRVRDLAHHFDFSAPQLCLLSLSYIVPDIGCITQEKNSVWRLHCLSS